MSEDIREQTVDKSRDTRGPLEKLSDLVTNDRVDDRTGKVIRDEGPGRSEAEKDEVVRRNDWIDPETDFESDANQGNLTRGDDQDALEKAADALTEDDIDDPVPRRRVSS